MAPDTHVPPLDLAEAERLAYETAVEQARAEAQAGQPSVPHMQVRQELLRFMIRMREEIATLRTRG